MRAAFLSGEAAQFHEVMDTIDKDLVAAFNKGLDKALEIEKRDTNPMDYYRKGHVMLNRESKRKLVELADSLDSKGFHKEADEIDGLIEDIGPEPGDHGFTLMRNLRKLDKEKENYYIGHEYFKVGPYDDKDEAELWAKKLNEMDPPQGNEMPVKVWSDPMGESEARLHGVVDPGELAANPEAFRR